MDKIYVIYWSQSGNTQAMAEAIGRGITDVGKEAEVVSVENVSLVKGRFATNYQSPDVYNICSK